MARHKSDTKETQNIFSLGRKGAGKRVLTDFRHPATFYGQCPLKFEALFF